MSQNRQQLIKLLTFLHVSVDYLMERTDDMNPTSSDDLTEPQKQVAYFIDPQATKEDIEQIKNSSKSQNSQKEDCEAHDV